MKVILISGKAQNGKDTMASILREKLIANNKRVLVAHYGDLLKYICRQFLGWNGEKDEDGRKLLQMVGTDIIRKENPDLWVDFIAMILSYFYNMWDYVIIPDCRFPNELFKMKEVGFDTIHMRVVRSNFESPLTEEQQKHESEVALDGIDADITVENSGDLNDLSLLIDKIIKDYEII